MWEKSNAALGRVTRELKFVFLHLFLQALWYYSCDKAMWRTAHQTEGAEPRSQGTVTLPSQLWVPDDRCVISDARGGKVLLSH